MTQILGQALAWAETCACLPSIPAGLADALRRRFHAEIPATREPDIRLLELSWLLPNWAGLDVEAELVRRFGQAGAEGVEMPA